MYKSNLIFVYMLQDKQGYHLSPPSLSQLDLDLSTCKIHSSVTPRLAWRTLVPLQCPCLQSVALLHFHPTMFEHSPKWEGAEKSSFNSWEFWGVWHLDWQQRTSKLFYCLCTNPVPGSSSEKRRTHWCPLLCNMWHYCPWLWFFLTEKHSENTPLIVIPILPQICGEALTVGTQLLFMLARLNHSWRFLVLMQHCFISRSKPSKIYFISLDVTLRA